MIKRIVLMVAALLLVGGACNVSDEPEAIAAPAQAEECWVPKPVAHRGGNEFYTENSLNAYKEVYKYGIQWWETDVRFDKNDVPFLMHDATLTRTTNGSGAPEAIDVLTTGVRLNDGQRIPTLAQFLDTALAYDATQLFIEFKTEPTTAQLQKFAIEVNKRNGVREMIVINSFDAARVGRVRNVLGTTGYRYSWVQDGGTQSAASVAAVGSVFNKAYDHLTRSALDAYNAEDVDTYAWTLDTPGQWAPVRTWPLAGVVTNKPVAYNAWRAWVCWGHY